MHQSVGLQLHPDANTEFHPSNCIPVILGCREAGYLEFNELANVDDGSCMTLWSELYANAINELEIININNESLNSSIESLENDLNIINQIFQWIPFNFMKLKCLIYKLLYIYL